MEVFEQIKGYIDRANSIVVAAHIHADGDAVGSVGAMYHMLKDMGKEAYMLLPNLVDTYDFLPRIEERVENVPLDSYDLLICLDTSNTERLNITKEDMDKAKSIVVIDHHMNNTIDAVAKYVDTEAPANCEIIYDVIKYMNHNIGKNIAEYIYMGIMTDTGSFNYQRTTSKTHRIAGEMIDAGADYLRTCKILNHTYSETKLKLVSKFINNMESYFEGKVRVGIIDKQTLDKFNAKEQDAENLVNYLRGIEGTIVAIYFRALENNTYKVSIRASEPIDAAELSQEFGGGGHKRAAGFSTDDVEKTKIKLIEILERLLKSEDNRNT
ncbi:MAG: bifunctional oligoribonuclease/PAP phosphatase NrnA [Clostridia bacterium]|nr:bifunctional oligoribonuclease/PAP phosphatase NrnA [Clostridia bacterium]